MPVAVTVTAAAAINRRRLMLNGKPGLAIMPSCETEGLAHPLRLPISRPHPLAGDHRAASSRLVKVPAFVLMQEMKMGRGLKQIKDYSAL
jgi:hypothetical protein